MAKPLDTLHNLNLLFDLSFTFNTEKILDCVFKQESQWLIPEMLLTAHNYACHSASFFCFVPQNKNAGLLVGEVKYVTWSSILY